MASVMTYGGYTGQDNETNLVQFQIATRFSPRNKRLSQTRSATIYGELIDSTNGGTSAIVTRANALINAFKDDNKDFRYTVGGVLAHSLLNSSDNLSGVRVLNTSFPHGDPAQLATTRSYTVTLQATYDVAETDLVSWSETIEVIGNGGPKFFVVDTVFGPRAIFTCPTSAVYYLQRGQAVGYSAYPTPASPISNPATPSLFNDQVRIGRISARNMGQQLRFYSISWNYKMARDVNAFGGVDPTPTSQ